MLKETLLKHSQELNQGQVPSYQGEEKKGKDGKVKPES